MHNDQNSDYDQLLERSQLPSLKIRRLRYLAMHTFKILNKKSPVYLHDSVNYKFIFTFLDMRTQWKSLG